jgi:hypothetical protein
MEDGRWKKEEAVIEMVLAIKNVLTVLAVAIFDFPFIPRKVRMAHPTTHSQESTVNSQQSTVNNYLEEYTL